MTELFAPRGESCVPESEYLQELDKVVSPQSVYICGSLAEVGAIMWRRSEQ